MRESQTRGMHQKDDRGRAGEDRAVRHLRRRGYRILDRNWRVAGGEIDIVASRMGVLVICEVKTRSSTAYGHPFEAIDAAKLGRLWRLARAWKVTHPRHHGVLRVDAIAVIGKDPRTAVVEHLRDLR